MLLFFVYLNFIVQQTINKTIGTKTKMAIWAEMITALKEGFTVTRKDRFTFMLLRLG